MSETASTLATGAGSISVATRSTAAGNVALQQVASFVGADGKAQAVSSGAPLPVTNPALLASMAAPLVAAGCRVWVCTCPPIPASSSDSWATAANQVASQYEANRESYNSDIRANYLSYGFSGVIDVASIVEDPANPGKWRTNGGAWTTDGVHPNSTNGHPALISAGVVPVGSFLAL